MKKKTTMPFSALRKGLTMTITAALLGVGQASAQSMLLLDPAGDGGFESGADFASNGWTVENYTSSNTNKWFVGNNGMPTSGNNAAYISGSATGMTYDYDTAAASRVMFWRDITFPQGYTAITLTFKVKAGGEKTGSGNNTSYYDALSIHFQNSDTIPGMGQPAADTTPTQASILNTVRLGTIAGDTGYITKTYYLNAGNATAATTRRLIFYWKNNDSLGMQPPPAIDEISVSASPPPAYDDADSAVMLTLGAGCANTTYNNIGARAAGGEPTASCRSSWNNGAIYRPVWFKFVAPASGAVRISTDYGGNLAKGGLRTALFSATDSTDYSTFNILHCAGNSGVNDYATNIFYPTGLMAGATYYVVVDVYSLPAQGTFCITVDELDNSMIGAAPADCVSGDGMGDYSWTGNNGDYKGWISLVDIEGKLTANIRQISGNAGRFETRRTIKTGTLRTDGNNGRSYMNRNFLINSKGSGTTTSADLQLFFTDAELAQMGSGIATLNVTRTAGSTCNANFTDGQQKSLLTQTANGSANGVNWIQVNTSGLSNFFIHTGSTTLPVENVDFKGRNITVSPNPTTGWLHININGNFSIGSSLQILDMLGKTVYRTQPLSGSITVDMSNLAAGQYYVRYTDANYSKTLKVVKN